MQMPFSRRNRESSLNKFASFNIQFDSELKHLVNRIKFNHTIYEIILKSFHPEKLGLDNNEIKVNKIKFSINNYIL